VTKLGRQLRAQPRRGAVYVEFLIAFVPLLCFFFSLVQFIFINVADLLVKYSAEKAVRAAIVVTHDDEAFYDSAVGHLVGLRKLDVERAARLPMSTMRLDVSAVNVTTKAFYGRNEPITVRVDYDYKCQVPWGRFLCCGFGATKRLSATATMPNQGAGYRYAME